MLNNYKNIKLNKLLKDIGGDSNISNKYISEHSGENPVYSAKTTGNMIKGCINSYKYDMECLQITSDGANAGTIIYRPKSKFSIGPATRIYYIVEKYKDLIELKYLYYTLKKILNSNEYSWTNKATKYKIDEIEIPIPINNDGQIDIEIQKEFIQKFEQLDKYFNKLLDYKKQVNSINVDIEINTSCVMRKIDKIFDLSKSTNSSKFTIGFINENQGDIPVYGAVNNENYASYGYVKDNINIEENKNGKITKTPVKYFENCLTYNIDGEGACGYVFYRTGRFSLSEKVRPLIIFDEYKDKLDPIYLKYVLHPLFLSKVRGRKINKTIIQDLQIPIPVKENGDFDLKVQKEIAEKYKKLELIKEQVINEIDKVLNITVEI